MKPKPTRATAVTPSQVLDLFFDDAAQVTDAQLLVLLLGRGSSRSAKGLAKKTWTAIELAHDLLATAGGRLEHLVASARRANFDRRSFALGLSLGSWLVAAMELAHRWRRGFKQGGDPRIRSSRDDDLTRRLLEHKVPLTEGELVAVLLTRYWVRQIKVGYFLKTYPSLGDMMQNLTPAAFKKGAWPSPEHDFGLDGICRVLAAIELARRHKARAEIFTSKPGLFGLTSRYLARLVNPGSPLDRPCRQKLLEKARSNPRLAADIAKLDQLAKDAGTDSYRQAIQRHAMFDALRRQGEWTRPAEVLGEPVPAGRLSCQARIFIFTYKSICTPSFRRPMR